MPRPADDDVVRRDLQLPDLALLLDADRLSARLKSTLGRPDITRVEVAYLRYKPGQSCMAACRAEVDGRWVELVAKAYRPSAVGKLRKAMTAAAVPGPLGPGRFVLDQSSVVVSVFPNDQRLPRLARLATPDSVARLFARLPNHTGVGGRLETLRHNPERRLVGKLVLDTKDIATVRCYTRPDFEAMVAKAGAVKTRGPLRVARLLTRWKRWHLLVFEWLDGELLECAIRHRSVQPSDMALVGSALAHLHDQDGRKLPRRTGAIDAAAVSALSHHLAFLHPPIAKLVRQLARRISAGLSSQDESVCPLHGDFYAKQVLLNGSTAAFVDFDEASLGTPAIDLARFRADLEASALAGHLEGCDVEPLFDHLLEGYRVIRRTLPADLDLHIAAQLLRVAAHPFRVRDPRWPQTLAAILDRAAVFLERDDTRVRRAGPALGTRHNISDPFGVASDGLMPFLHTALNPSEIAPRFARSLDCLNSAKDTHVAHISVLRHKPGRRCLVLYELTVHDSANAVRHLRVVGKMRARGADTTTHDLQRSLWTGSFGAFATDGILVPEPLGVLRDLQMTVQRGVSGVPLTGLLEGPCGVALAGRAAEAIHKLHSARAPVSRRHTVEDELRILRERLRRVAEARPQWHERIERVLDACVRLAARVQEDSCCGIHRDFYPDQVLVDEERLHLTDLDLYAHGPAALDVGNFVAHVYENSLRRFGNPNHLCDRTERLIERYLQLSPATTRASIRAWTTLSLVRHIAISSQFAERRPFTPALLDLCECRLLGGRPATRPARISGQ